MCGDRLTEPLARRLPVETKIPRSRPDEALRHTELPGDAALRAPGQLAVRHDGPQGCVKVALRGGLPRWSALTPTGGPSPGVAHTPPQNTRTASPRWIFADWIICPGVRKTLAPQRPQGSAIHRQTFAVDGTLIEAWASLKSFRPRDEQDPPAEGGRNPERDFRGHHARMTRTFQRPMLRRGSTPRATVVLHQAMSYETRAWRSDLLGRDSAHRHPLGKMRPSSSCVLRPASHRVRRRLSGGRVRKVGGVPCGW